MPSKTKTIFASPSKLPKILTAKNKISKPVPTFIGRNSKNNDGMESIKSTIRFRNEAEIENLQKAREMYSDKTDNDIFNIAIDVLANKLQEMQNEISELITDRALEREKFQELQKSVKKLFDAETQSFLAKNEIFKKTEIIKE